MAQHSRCRRLHRTPPGRQQSSREDEGLPNGLQCVLPRLRTEPADPIRILVKGVIGHKRQQDERPSRSWLVGMNVSPIQVPVPDELLESFVLDLPPFFQNDPNSQCMRLSRLGSRLSKAWRARTAGVWLLFLCTTMLR